MMTTKGILEGVNTAGFDTYIEGKMPKPDTPTPVSETGNVVLPSLPKYTDKTTVYFFVYENGTTSIEDEYSQSIGVNQQETIVVKKLLLEVEWFKGEGIAK